MTRKREEFDKLEHAILSWNATAHVYFDKTKKFRVISMSPEQRDLFETEVIALSELTKESPEQYEIDHDLPKSESLTAKVSYRVIKRAVHPAKPVIVKAAPGANLLKFIAWLPFSKKTTKEVFVQTIADMREEYYADLFAGRKWRAKAVLLWGYVSITYAFVALVLSTAKKALDIFKIVGG